MHKIRMHGDSIPWSCGLVFHRLNRQLGHTSPLSDEDEDRVARFRLFCNIIDVPILCRQHFDKMKSETNKALEGKTIA